MSNMMSERPRALDCIENFSSEAILAEYSLVQTRTKENQRRLADILKRDPSVENFSSVYSIVQRLLESERREHNLSSTGRPGNPYIRHVIKHLEQGAVGLEIGCSQGRMVEYLVQQGFFLIGIDSASVAIDAARQRSAGHDWANKCAFYAMDARDLKAFKADSFDFAISNEVVEHLGMPGFVMHLDQLRRVLKTDGKYFLTCPSALISGVEGDLHIRMYYFREMHHLAEMMGFRVNLTLNYRNRFLITLPRAFNPLLMLYEAVLRRTKLNYLLNKLRLTILCLPLMLVFTKVSDSSRSKEMRDILVRKGCLLD